MKRNRQNAGNNKTKKKLRPVGLYDLPDDDPSTTEEKVTSTRREVANRKGKLGGFQKVKGAFKDPSTKYLKNPVDIPMVHAARAFFASPAIGYHPREFLIWQGPSTGWRCCAKLAVRGQSKPLIGLFAPGSVDIIHMTQFATHSNGINMITEQIYQNLQKAGIRGYDGKTQDGLSYLVFNSGIECVSSEVDFQPVQVTFVFNETSTHAEELTLKVKKAMKNVKPKSLVQSVWLRCHPTSPHDNNILGRDDDPDSLWILVEGEEYLLDSPVNLNIFGTELTDPVRLHFSPKVFRQANLRGFTEIIGEIRNWVPRQSKVMEMYGGIGTIGLHIVDLCESLICSDENPNNLICFKNSRKSITEKEIRRRARYIPSSAKKVVEEFLPLVEEASVIIVDPPRKGLEPEVLKTFCEQRKGTRIIYVSCGFKAFQHDCDQLIKIGKYRLEFAKGFVLFPGADHLETLAIFDK